MSSCCAQICSNPNLDLASRVIGKKRLDQEYSELSSCVALYTDILGRLKTADKIPQLGHTAPAIPSLKIPGYQWWSEALHGVAGSPGVHFGGNVRT